MPLFICWFQPAHELEILEGWGENLLLQYFQLDKNQTSIGNFIISSMMYWPRKSGEDANKHPDVWINPWTEKKPTKKPKLNPTQKQRWRFVYS